MLKVNYKVEVDNVLLEEKTNFTIKKKKDKLLVLKKIKFFGD